jgi:gliding motility-associated-like protein
MQIKIIAFLILAFLFCNKTNGQTDTLFWFAAPEILNITNDNITMDRPIVINITTYEQTATVTISQPAVGGMPTQIVNIPANSTRSVDLTTWIDNIECKPANSILNYGLKISSTSKISAYYEVNANGLNPDLFVLKGKNALGTDFWISSQYFLDNSIGTFSSFNIVATEDNTLVTITPSKNIIGHLANSTFSITLNKGQTYAAVASSELAAQHLHGSRVISNKLIAITLSDDELAGVPYGGCADLGGDQTVPTNIIGMEYIAIKGGLNSPFDKLFILATQNGTTVRQDGVLLTTLNAGQSYQASITNPSTYIQCSNPAYVYQLSGIGCEAGTAVLPKINCTGSSSITFTRTSTEFLYVTILVKNGGQNNFLLNNTTGIILQSQFNPVPGTSNQWYAAKIQLTNPVGSVIKLTNSTHLFHLGVLQGGTISGTGYGYFSDFGAISANAFTTTPNICSGTTINLFADTVLSATYNWTGPNSFTSNVQNPKISNSAPANTGKYILTVSVPNCGNYLDSININVKLNTISEITQTICQGQSFLGYTSSGIYIDTLIAANGCDSIRTLNLTVLPFLTSTINATICQGDSFAGYNIEGIYIDTFKSSNGCDSIRTLNLSVKPISLSNINISICEGESYLGHTVSGIYTDTLISANGCDSVQTLNLTVKPKASSNQNISICNGESYLGYTVSGRYIDTLIASNGCDSIRTLMLNVKETFYSSISTSICAGENYLGYTESGTYVDTLTALNGCDSIVSINLTVLNTCEVYFPSAFTPNNDGKNDVFRILNANNLVDYNLSIFNRWGQRVFETRDYTKGWNGNFNGNSQPSGIYVWYSTFKLAGKDRKMKGTVALIR